MNVPGAQCKGVITFFQRKTLKIKATGHETFPILYYLPAWLNETKRTSLEFRKMGRENFASLVEEVRTKMTTDNALKWSGFVNKLTSVILNYII